MKKRYGIMLLLLSLLLCLSACNGEGDDGTGEPTGPLAEWSRAFSGGYESVRITIDTTIEDILLTSVYEVQGETVSYSVERLRLLPSSGNASEIPEENRETLTGSAEVRDGRLYHLNGDAVDLPSFDALHGAFSFDEDSLSNVTVEEGVLRADVRSVADFLGTEAELTDVCVSAEKQGDTPKKLELHGQMGGSSVRILYEFG